MKKDIIKYILNSNPIAALFLTLGILTLGFIYLPKTTAYIASYEKYIKEQAVTNCYAVARHEVETRDGTKNTWPDQDWYTRCMQEKGYK